MDQPNEAQSAAVDVSPTRRAFYIGFINGAMSLIGLALAVPAAIYLLLPPKLRKGQAWVETADLSKIPSGTPTEIFFERTSVDGWKVTTVKAGAWVVKGPYNEVVAFTPNAPTSAVPTIGTTRATPSCVPATTPSFPSTARS